MAKPETSGLRKLYFTISEAAEISGVPAHVLRYWESEFPGLNPHKSKSGNRLYQEKDLALIEQIKTLLYKKKFTIAGARAQLTKRKTKSDKEEILSDIKEGLREILDILDDNTGRGAVR